MDEMNEVLKIQIWTPEKLLIEQDCVKVVAYGEAGYFTVLPGHMKMVSNLNIGELVIDIKATDITDAAKIPFFVAGGCIQIKKDVIQVFTSACEKVSDIEIDRAKEAINRAQETLRHAKGGIDYDRAKLAHDRAEVRIELAKKYGRGTDD